MTNFNGIELDVASAGNNELYTLIDTHKLCTDPEVKDLFLYTGNEFEGAKQRDVRVAAAQAICVNCVAIEACNEVALRIPKRILSGIYAGVEYDARHLTVQKYREQMQNLIAINKK
ncbi:MAG: WhiB family transcriptional regulator [bacterium]